MAEHDLWLTMAFVLGIGAEYFDDGPQTGMERAISRWFPGALILLNAVGQADSWRGFLYLAAMPIGLYKLGRMTVELVRFARIWWPALRRS